jgi:cyclic beta-1,2-glucan synthetase
VLAFAHLGDGDRAMELFAMLNPAHQAQTPDDVARYRVEPYVVAADVYSTSAHVGRGGWTWYTGSAAWMYQVGIEALLGLTLRRGALRIDPCIPREWTGYEATVRTPHGQVRIVIENPDGVTRGVRLVELDGAALDGDVRVHSLTGAHTVRVVLGT